jgi:hypothetical protein
LEYSLPDASKDAQVLWKLWEKTKAGRTSSEDDHKANFILLLLACGTVASSLMDPRLYQTMNYLLSAFGLGKLIHFFRESRPRLQE